MRRFGGVLFGVVLVAAATLVPMVPAAANGFPSVSLSIAAFCNPATGQHQLDYTLDTLDAASIEVTSFVQTPPGTDLAASFSPNPFTKDQPSKATGNVPGNVLPVSIAIELKSGGLTHGENFNLIFVEPCAMTADLQVDPTTVAVGDTVTISGTGCLQPVVGTDGASVQGVSGGDIDVQVVGDDTSALADPVPGTVSGTVGFDPPVAFGPIAAAADGTWSTQVVVPPGTPPGTYPVDATCTYPPVAGNGVSGQAVTDTSFDYQAKSVVVPVVLIPNFAG